MIIVDCDQGSQEWFDARCGVPSASNFKKIITSTGKPSTQAKTYINELLAEKIMGVKTDSNQTEWMTRGIELEQEAVELYELVNDLKTKEVGFILDDSRSFGCSPDRLLENGGLEISGLEVKCPKPSTHVSYLLANKVPSEYYAQVQGCMLITGAKWWDFMSYCPSMEPLIIRCERDAKYLETLLHELESFSKKLTKNYQQLTKKVKNNGSRS